MWLFCCVKPAANAGGNIERLFAQVRDDQLFISGCKRVVELVTHLAIGLGKSVAGLSASMP